MAIFAVVFLLVIVLILAVQLHEKMTALDFEKNRSARWLQRYDELAAETDRRFAIHCDTLRHARRIQAASTCILNPKLE